MFQKSTVPARADIGQALHAGGLGDLVNGPARGSVGDVQFGQAVFEGEAVGMSGRWGEGDDLSKCADRLAIALKGLEIPARSG